MDDLFSLFTSLGRGIALFERLNGRISTQTRYKKHPKNVVRQVYTPTQAACLGLELEMPEKR